MAETKDWIIVIIGYILAILINGIGLIYGLVLYFIKGDDEFYRTHSIIITAIAAAITLAAVVLLLTGAMPV